MRLDLITVGTFLGISLYIGYASSKKVQTLSHFSVGNRSFSSFLIFCTLSASFIGGGYTFGNAAKVYLHGMLYAFALLGFSLKEMLIGIWVAPHMEAFQDCHSIGDIMRKQYGRVAQLITGFLSLIICGGILGAQVGALGAIINVTLGISPMLGMLGAVSVLLVYTTLGGMRAVVLTDVLQFSLLAVGIPMTFFIALHHVGGWERVVSTVPHHYLFFISSMPELLLFCLLFISFMFGEILIPPYVQRLLMARSISDTVRATFLSGVVSIPIFLLCGGLGLIAFSYNHHLDANDVFPWVVKTILPLGLRGFMIAAMLSIILSSSSGLLNAASMAFVQDIMKNIPGKPIQEEHLLRWARMSTVVVGMIAVIFSAMIQNVLDILLLAYNFWSPIILVPLLAVIFKLSASARDFFIGAVCGVIGASMCRLIWPASMNAGPLISGIMLNAIGFFISYGWHKNNKGLQAYKQS